MPKRKPAKAVYNPGFDFKEMSVEEFLNRLPPARPGTRKPAAPQEPAKELLQSLVRRLLDTQESREGRRRQRSMDARLRRSVSLRLLTTWLHQTDYVCGSSEAAKALGITEHEMFAWHNSEAVVPAITAVTMARDLLFDARLVQVLTLFLEAESASDASTRTQLLQEGVNAAISAGDIRIPKAINWILYGRPMHMPQPWDA